MALSKVVVEEGKPDQLGAIHDGRGVNFAIFSAHATKVELCLFDEEGKNEIRRIELPKKTGDIWHGYIPDLKPGQVYGYRVHGPFAPEQGHRFNPNKLVLDPYARDIVGQVKWTAAQHDFASDNAGDTVKARVVETLPKVAGLLNTAWEDTYICELHAKGYTMADPKVDPALRGKIAALASKPVTDYFKEMGYSAIEPLPVMAKLHDERLEKAGLKNYWGYNTLCYFAVEPEYLKSGNRKELRETIDRLRENGVEVILDIVFNHTAEGNHTGPTLSFRGIDNASYYKLDPGDKSRYIDETGCGNTLNVEHPAVRRLIIDNLRMWVEEFGVAGFRFDLAPVLGRTGKGFDKECQLFKEIMADPVLSKVKLNPEPWDCAPGGYQLGNFPPGWHEWNDRFRDDVRRFWREDADMIGKKATRLLGSSPEFADPGRGPLDSINFVACHDGFTLHDLVSYNGKHNLANGEGNRDGNDNNVSNNHGTEGPTDNPAIIAARERTKRNLMASLFLAQGVPMVLGGDEFGNSQSGNNNAYCQDNETGWLKWDKITDKDRVFTKFMQRLARFRKDHPVLQHDEFINGQKACDHGVRDIHWFNPAGREMQEADWKKPHDRCLGMFLNDGAVNGEGAGKRLLAVFNASGAKVDFKLPDLPGGGTWERVLDTAEPDLEKDPRALAGSYKIPEKSTVVFVQMPSNKLKTKTL